MTSVRIPPTLRAETGGRRDVELAGDTVRDVLTALLAEFPGLDGRLLAQGQLQTFVNVFLDGTDVRALDGLDTPAGENSTLLLLPAMAGGGGSSRRAWSSPTRLLRGSCVSRHFSGPTRRVGPSRCSSCATTPASVSTTG